MKSENTPTYEDEDLLTKKDNLITTNKPIRRYNRKNMDANKFFVPEDENSPDETQATITFCFYIEIVLFISLIISLLTLYYIFFSLEGSWDEITIYEKIVTLLGPIAILALFIISNAKLVIRKRKLKKKVIIKVINFLCCPKKKIVLDIENTLFKVTSNTTYYGEDNDNEWTDTTLYIYNNYKNLVGIDLDNSDIRQKPAKFLYYFENITNSKYNINKLENDLYDFIEINKYSFSRDPGYYRIGGSTYEGKFNENFFTFHILNPINASCFDCLIITLSVILNSANIIGILVMLMISNKNMLLVLVCSLIIVNIFLYILYSCIKSKIENIYRIDCIYSKDFNRIFIGLVKYTKTSYVNTFEYQINDINSFILQQAGDDKIFNLKVVFKDKEKQQICRIKGYTQEQLRGFAFLLNERLIDDEDDDNKNSNKI